MGGRSEVFGGGDDLLKTLLPKIKNPKVWPATATKNTPPLKDIIASITKKASPTLIACKRVWIKPAATWFASGFINLQWESHSTNTANTNTTIKAKAYIPELVPGQPEKRISEFLPQKNVMCIMLWWCIIVPVLLVLFIDMGGDMLPWSWCMPSMALLMFADLSWESFIESFFLSFFLSVLFRFLTSHRISLPLTLSVTWRSENVDLRSLLTDKLGILNKLIDYWKSKFELLRA